MNHITYQLNINYQSGGNGIDPASKPKEIKRLIFFSYNVLPVYSCSFHISLLYCFL